METKRKIFKGAKNINSMDIEILSDLGLTNAEIYLLYNFDPNDRIMDINKKLNEFESIME